MVVLKVVGQIKIVKDLDNSVAGRHIIFVEDIIDTGRTLKELKELFALRRAHQLKLLHF
jgi:hypoxanthine phosphoribosyltransferase